MIEKLKIGNYGQFHFTLQKKGMTEKMGFNLIATVIGIDRYYILLRDNDDIEYLPKKADIDCFEPCEAVAG